MTDYRYSISLRLRHPSWDPTEATAILGMTPSRSWRAGEARTTPKGRPLTGFRDASYWTAPLTDGDSKQLHLCAAIADAARSLAPHTAFLVEFAESGGKSEFFIGWFFDEGNSGDVLDWRLLESLAQLRVDLSFDVYSTDSDAEPKSHLETHS